MIYARRPSWPRRRLLQFVNQPRIVVCHILQRLCAPCVHCTTARDRPNLAWPWELPGFAEHLDWYSFFICRVWCVTLAPATR